MEEKNKYTQNSAVSNSLVSTTGVIKLDVDVKK